MKNKHYPAFAALATAIIGFSAASASAQNPTFDYGQLTLGFQAIGASPGSDKTVLVNIGESYLFRDATSNILNIINIGGLLTDTFGASWYDNTNLFFGVIGSWDSGDPLDLRFGDPNRTLYFSKSRTGLGDESLKNSTIANIGTNNAMASGALAISAVQTKLETGSIGLTGVFPTSEANTWDKFSGLNVSNGNQGTAFSAISSGIQQRFGSGSFGTFSIGAVEGALDLYRFQAANDLAGQYGFGDPLRTGEFQGIVTLDQAGNVSFIAVPEPASALLLGGAALGLALRRRRASV